MGRRRFYVSPEQIHDGIAELPPDQTHRLRDVLRLGSDSEIEVFDGKGAVFAGRLDFSRPQPRVVDLKPIANPDSAAPRLALAAAIIKPARFEWMLEKATELGVDEFIPLITKHSEFPLTDANLRPRLERWQRIVRQACEQCGRAVVPVVRNPMPWPDFLAHEEFSVFTRLLCFEGGGTPLNRISPAGPVALCIGPEGGWESSEIECALKAGCQLVSLGHSTLRAETAALAAVTLIRIAD